MRSLLLLLLCHTAIIYAQPLDNAPEPVRVPVVRSCDIGLRSGYVDPRFVKVWNVNIAWACGASPERQAWIFHHDGSCMDNLGRPCTWYYELDEIVVLFGPNGCPKFRGRPDAGGNLFGRLVQCDCAEGCWSAAPAYPEGNVSPGRPEPSRISPVMSPTRQQHASPN